MQEKPIQNKNEQFKKVALSPELTFASKISPIYSSEIIDTITGEKIGHVEFQLNHRTKTIEIPSVFIDKPRQGYGISVYQSIQALYPDYVLRSSDQMNKKDDPSQEKPNAVYLWEKLVSLGFAEKDDEGVFRTKKVDDPSASK